MFLFLLGKYLQVDLLGHIIYLCLTSNCCKLPKCSSGKKIVKVSSLVKLTCKCNWVYH